MHTLPSANVAQTMESPTMESSSCTECSSSTASLALKGRHKSAIKASNSETMLMCVNIVLAVLARLAAAALAVRMAYKLIADSGNQNKTSDNKVL